MRPTCVAGDPVVDAALARSLGLTTDEYASIEDISRGTLILAETLASLAS